MLTEYEEIVIDVEEPTQVSAPNPRELAHEFARTLRPGSIITEKNRDGLGVEAAVYLLGVLRAKGLYLEYAAGEGWRVKRG